MLLNHFHYAECFCMILRLAAPLHRISETGLRRTAWTMTLPKPLSRKNPASVRSLDERTCGTIAAGIKMQVCPPIRPQLLKASSALQEPGQPFLDFPGPVDAHADQKDHKLAFHSPRHALRDDSRDGGPPSINMLLAV